MMFEENEQGYQCPRGGPGGTELIEYAIAIAREEPRNGAVNGHVRSCYPCKEEARGCVQDIGEIHMQVREGLKGGLLDDPQLRKEYMWLQVLKALRLPGLKEAA
jgi:hypothetical protein